MIHELGHSKSSLLPHWDGYSYTRFAAKFYDRATALSGWRQTLARHALVDLPRGRMLDLGCGTGYLMNLARSEGFAVTGLDSSEGMLAQAQAHYGFDDRELCLSSAESIPRGNGSFEVVMASGSLVDMPDIEQIAREVCRVLLPGGRLRVIDHAMPLERDLLTPMAYVFSQLSGDILHDYRYFFNDDFALVNHRTLGRGGYLQLFDFVKI